jgi:ribonuclease Z
LLRLFLGRNKDLFLCGPQGFMSNVEGKLAGYCWNLVQNYENRFILRVVELHPDRALSRSYHCRNGFSADDTIRETPFDGVVLKEPALSINAVHLDHGTPVLAFALTERFHINIIKEKVDHLGLLPGPWLNYFKTLLYDDADPGTLLEIPSLKNDGSTCTFSLGDLKRTISRISPGQRLAYIADAADTPDNREKIIAIAAGVDHLFIEAAFSHVHVDIARQKHHLTSRQAGKIARDCQVKQYSLFHYSPRYSDCPDVLEAEAKNAYSGQ